MLARRLVAVFLQVLRWKHLRELIWEVAYGAFPQPKPTDVSLERRAGNWFQNVTQQSNIRTQALVSLSPPPLSLPWYGSLPWQLGRGRSLTPNSRVQGPEPQTGAQAGLSLPTC